MYCSILCNILIIFLAFKPGNPRTAEATKKKLEGQIGLACRGVMKPIMERQTKTGVKDAYTQYWIEDLIKKFHQDKQANPQKHKADIEKELLEWVNGHKDKIYSGFLSTKGL